MSIIKNIEVELSDLVEDCHLILEVAYKEAFEEEVTIKSIDPKVSPPPFKKQGIVFTMTNVLKNADQMEVPQTIRVPNANWRRSLNQHKELYGGPSKSYSVKYYNTEVKSMRSAAILFLHHFQGTFELETKGSFESGEALDKITMLLKAK
jgi:hypothetical protein